MATNSRRKLKKLKVSAGESLEIVNQLTNMLAAAGIPVSLPCHIVPAIASVLSPSQRGQATRAIPPAAPQVPPHGPPRPAIPAAQPAEEAPMQAADMERIYREKLGRTMQVAEAAEIHVNESGQRIARPVQVPQRVVRTSDPDAESDERGDSFEGFEEDDDTSLESDPAPSDADTRVNAKTGHSLAEQREIIAKITGRAPKAPEPGRPNPKALGVG